VHDALAAETHSYMIYWSSQSLQRAVRSFPGAVGMTSLAEGESLS
jgi:hypothetical protein